MVEEKGYTCREGFGRVLSDIFGTEEEWILFDLSALNTHLVIPKFQMESTLTIMGSLRQGNWVVSNDVGDAYLHVPIHPEYRKFLHLAFPGEVAAPYAFTL